MTNLQTITVDLTPRPDTRDNTIFLKRGDKESREVVVNLRNNGDPYPVPNGVKVQYAMCKPDRTQVLADIPNSGIAADTVRFTLAEQCMTVTGAFPAELRLLEDGQVLKTASFRICVQPSAFSDDLATSSDDYASLNDALARVDEVWDAYESGEFSGKGVPSGGAAGQVLAKNTAVDYDTHWVSVSGGASSYSASILYADAPPNGLTPLTCDGKTDDTAAFRALVDYCYQKGGGIIQLPAGSIRITDQITWQDHVSLVGAGMEATTILMEGTGYAAIDFDRDVSGNEARFHGVAFRDFGIDGIKCTGEANPVGTKGIFLLYMERCVFQNLLIKNTIGTGLGVDYLRDCLIENVHTVNCGKDWVEGEAGQAGIGIGTGQMEGESMVIRDCIARGCGQFGIFVEVQLPAAYTPKNVLIEGCIAEDGLNDGINIRTGSNMVISNCRAEGNARHGISFSGAGENIAILNSQAYGNASDGIAIISASNSEGKSQVAVSGCICAGNQGNGINLDSKDDSLEQGSLRVVANQCYENDYSGIRAGSLGTADYLQISDNHCYQNGYDGITFNLSGGWQCISENHCHSNGTADGVLNNGLYIAATHNYLHVANNRLHNNPTGLRLTSTASISGGEFVGNMISQNTSDVIDGASANTASTYSPLLISDDDVVPVPNAMLLQGTGIKVEQDGQWVQVGDLLVEKLYILSAEANPTSVVVNTPVTITAVVSGNTARVVAFYTDSSTGISQQNAAFSPNDGGTRAYSSQITFGSIGIKNITLFARDKDENQSEEGVSLIIKVTES